MPAMSFWLNGDGAFADLVDKPKDQIINAMGENGAGITVAVLEGGMASGKPSVAIRIDLPDGRTVLTETSALLFCSAGRMIEGRFPNLRE